MPILLHAVHAHQARRLFASDARWRETAGIKEVPEDRAGGVGAGGRRAHRIEEP